MTAMSRAMQSGIAHAGHDPISLASRLRPNENLNRGAMGFYADHILPHLINLAMRNRDLAAYRGRVVPAAAGRVLEIGIGSGLNLPLYGGAVEEVIGIDTSPEMLAMAERAVATSDARHPAE